jgi:hypothetical protein
MPKKITGRAAIVTEEYVLEKFVDLLDSDAPWATKVKGLELLGKYLSMFQDQKKVDINIRSLIAGASFDDLKRLAGERYDPKMVGSDSSYTDIGGGSTDSGSG